VRSDATSSDEASTRIQGCASAGWGVLLLVGGRRWWLSSMGRAPTSVERTALVVLAGRQLVQGLAQVAWPGRLRRTWPAVDLAHASSMVLLASRNASVRRPALLSAGVAAVNASWSLLSLRRRR
jgi:hypothetical protein